MKKTVGIAAACIAVLAGIAGFSACGKKDAQYTVYAPDGAPALALVNAINQEDKTFSYSVIDATTVQAQVTGENPKADFCILPLNLASKLLGSGEKYQMLGTVTNGNIYFLTTGENPVLTPENLSTALIGKTVGVVQYANVPGLTLQAVLNDYAIEYQAIAGVNAEKSDTKVNLVPIADAATGVTPAGGCDYYLCPEPAVTAKIKGTASGAKPFKAAGDLQQLYGGVDGYPQAVLVAKKSVLSSDKRAVEKLAGYISACGEYLSTAQTDKVLSLLDGVRTPGVAPAFNANNLNAEVIAHCSVKYTAAKDCKAKVTAFLTKLIAVNANSASTVQDAFFYEG